MSKILFAVLPRKHQIKILSGYYDFAKEAGAKCLTPTHHENPLLWYDMVYEQYLSLKPRVKRQQSVQQTLDYLSLSVEQSFVDYVYISIKAGRSIPIDDDPDARIIIDKVCKTQGLSYIYRDPPLQQSDHTLPVSSSVVHDSTVDTGIPKGEDDGKRVNRKKSNSNKTPPSHSAKHKETQIVKENTSENRSKELNAEGVRVCDASVQATYQVCDAEVVAKPSTHEVGVQTDYVKIEDNAPPVMFKLKPALRKVSSKIRRYFKTKPPLSSYEIRRICAILYNVLKYVPARIIRQQVFHLLKDH